MRLAVQIILLLQRLVYSLNSSVLRQIIVSLQIVEPINTKQLYNSRKLCQLTLLGRKKNMMQAAAYLIHDNPLQNGDFD